MEERTKKIIIWVVAIAVGLIVIFAVSGILDNIWYKYSQSQFSVEKEEFCYTYDRYYAGNAAFPNKCPAVKLTIRNNSDQAMMVYGEINFYKDGELFTTAYMSTDTLAPNDVIVEMVSATEGVRWNSFDSYEWTYKIVSITCNYV